METGFGIFCRIVAIVLVLACDLGGQGFNFPLFVQISPVPAEGTTGVSGN